MKKYNSIPIRVDKDLKDVLQDIAKKNDMNLRQASKELAEMSKRSMKGKKLTREVTF